MDRITSSQKQIPKKRSQNIAWRVHMVKIANFVFWKDIYGPKSQIFTWNHVHASIESLFWNLLEHHPFHVLISSSKIILDWGVWSNVPISRRIWKWILINFVRFPPFLRIFMVYLYFLMTNVPGMNALHVRNPLLFQILYNCVNQ